MILLDILTVVAFLISAGVVSYTVFYRHKLSRFISVEKLGIIERDLPNLKQVIVVADRVEKPSSTLEEAVEDNFREGVKYLFLVSHSSAEQELTGYFLIFEALAKIALSGSRKNVNIRDFVEIKRLPYDWPDVPYIFYQYSPDDTENRYTVAFRGNEKGEGIADFYEQLSSSNSLAIKLALLAEAPAEIRANLKLVDNIASENSQSVAWSKKSAS